MEQWEFQALGTHWWIEVAPGTNTQHLKETTHLIVRQFESDYSRFKPDSLLSKLNDSKRCANAPAEMLAMLQFGLDTFAATYGVFNMSVGAKLEQLGYGRPEDAQAHISLDLLDDVTIAGDSVTIAPHVRLDFGGFGKGWLVDKLANHFKSLKIVAFIINGGGDIYVHSPSRAQEIIIQHPFDHDTGIGRAELTEGGIAASSAQKRHWTNNNGQQHHIIDSFHGSTKSLLASVHVVAESTLIADTLGTVFLLIDHAERLRLARKYNATFVAVNDDLSYYKMHNCPIELNS